MKLEDVEKMQALIDSGHAGVMPDGKIVDRRIHPEAVPMQKTDLLGIPEAKRVL